MKRFIPTLLLIPVCALALDPRNAAGAPPEAEDTPTVAIVTASPGAPPHMHLSRTGLGSFYWAARHPAQAWRVLFPIQEGSVALADLRASCALSEDLPRERASCP
jgi:hypothetical protein